MNTPDVFKRVEYKYLLSPQQFDSLTESLADKIRPDEFGGSTISSLYYDTRQFAMINRSLEKPVYKEKLRIRAYGTPEDGDPVYVELKKKFRGVVYKRRVPLTANAAYAFMGGVSYRSAALAFPLADAALQDGCLLPRRIQIAEEISQCCKRWEMPRPAMMVCVEREAYRCISAPDLRITFDIMPRWRTDDLFFSAEQAGHLLYPDDKVIMEIKCTDAYPFWLIEELDKHGVYPQPNSKYGLSYQEYHHLSCTLPRRRSRAVPEARIAAFAG